MLQLISFIKGSKYSQETGLNLDNSCRGITGMRI